MSGSLVNGYLWISSKQAKKEKQKPKKRMHCGMMKVSDDE